MQSWRVKESCEQLGFGLFSECSLVTYGLHSPPWAELVALSGGQKSQSNTAVLGCLQGDALTQESLIWKAGSRRQNFIAIYNSYYGKKLPCR